MKYEVHPRLKRCTGGTERPLTVFDSAVCNWPRPAVRLHAGKRPVDACCGQRPGLATAGASASWRRIFVGPSTRWETIMETAGNVVHREPWNKGKIVGQKAPFKLKDIWA